MTFVNTLVSQHWLTNDVTDSEDVWNVSSQLLVNSDETSVVNFNTSLTSVQVLTVWNSTDSNQNSVVSLWFRWSLLTFHSNVDTVFLSFNSSNLSFQHQVELLRDSLSENLNDVLVSRWDNLVEHFNNVDLRTQSVVNSTHFQTDDTTTHNQQSFWNFLQFQSVSRVPDSWVFVWDEWQLDWTRTSSDDSVVEVDNSLTVFTFNFQSVSTSELTQTVNNLNLSTLSHTSQTTSQLVDNLFLPSSDLVDVSLWFTENDTVFSQSLSFFDNLSNVQQSLRWDTTNVQTNTTQSVVSFNDNSFQTQVSTSESSRVTRWTSTQNNNLSLDFSRHF
ncbi:hypothetical protein BS732_4455 [Bacillus subtilis MB73/2]|nr:hypothetical protein BS732_4455 [Bacillus subtilis MB73/2]